MAQRAYIGVGGVARQVKKIYTGVGNVARQVKKAYVGVNGVARLFFAAERKIVKLSNNLSLSGYAAYPKSASTQDNVIIDSIASADNKIYNGRGVDSFNSNLVRRSLSQKNGSSERAINLGSNVLFFNTIITGMSQTRDLTVYDRTLTKKNIDHPNLWVPSCANFNNFVFCATGFTPPPDGNLTEIVFVYDTNLTKRQLGNLGERKGASISATVDNDYVLFAGGQVSTIGTLNPTWTTSVQHYNKNLVRGNAQNLSRATSCGFYAGFFFGNYPLDRQSICTKTHALIPLSGNDGACDVYDKHLVKSTHKMPYNGRAGTAISKLDENIVLVGGGFEQPQSKYLDVSDVFAYDDTLVVKRVPSLSYSRSYMSSNANIGNYTLFAGGSRMQYVNDPNLQMEFSNKVETYTIE